MNELLTLTVNLHIFFIVATIIFVVINLMVAHNTDDFDRLAKRIRFVLPMYYMLLSMIFFTGLVLLGVMHFSITLSIAGMLVVWVINLVLTIKAYKQLKLARTRQDEMLKKHFFWYIKRKWITDLVLIVLTTLFAWRIGI